MKMIDDRTAPTRRGMLAALGGIVAGATLGGATYPALATLRSSHSGVWDTEHGPLRLHSFGDYVIGDYADRGIIVGAYYSGPRGLHVHGVFTNGAKAGTFDWRMRGAFLDGTWRFVDGSGRGEWVGNLARPGMPGQMHNFTRSGRTSMITRNPRTEVDGTYDSPFGRLDLTGRDLMLVGGYADKGVIAAQWVSNGYEGVFTNGTRAGWMRWPFLSRDMTPTETIAGGSEWGWHGQGSSGSWPIQRISQGPIRTPKWLTPPPTFDN